MFGRLRIAESLEEIPAYHSTNADFDKFDLSFAKSGLGSMVYGYGVYVATDEEVAKGYWGRAVDDAKEGITFGGNRTKAVKYTVEIPDDNGRNYLNWDGPAFDFSELTGKKNLYAKTFGDAYQDAVAEIKSQRGIEYVAAQKAVSMFLHEKGFVGIKVVGFRGTSADKGYNYVVFDENDCRIVKKEHIGMNVGGSSGVNVNGLQNEMETVMEFKNGTRLVTHSRDFYNVVDKQGKTLYREWFLSAEIVKYEDGGWSRYWRVTNSSKQQNVLNDEGKLVSLTWFRWVSDLFPYEKNGKRMWFFEVYNNKGEANAMSESGRIILDQWTFETYPAEIRKKLETTNETLEEALLNENRESKNINLARKYLKGRGMTQENADQIVDAIRHDIPNTRLADCKFLLGVVRMYANNELNSASTIAELNKTLKYVGSGVHVNEYSQDLNGLGCGELIDRFTTVSNQDLENDMKRSQSRNITGGSRYKIVRIPDFETAKEYSPYTEWCVTKEASNYNTYTYGGMGIFYFCLIDGFQSVEKVVGENCPLDEYGLSMIAVSVNEDGSCNTITCRWNHDNGGNDNIVTVEELENILNVRFYQTFKPRTREEIMRESLYKADYVLSYLNDESGEDETEMMNEYEIDGETLYTWSGFDGWHSADLEYSVILRKNEDGFELALDYAFPEEIAKLMPDNTARVGYNVLTASVYSDGPVFHWFDTNKMAYIGGMEDDSTVIRVGEKYCVAALRRGKIQIVDTNGDVLYQSPAKSGLMNLYKQAYSLYDQEWVSMYAVDGSQVKLLTFANGTVNEVSKQPFDYALDHEGMYIAILSKNTINGNSGGYVGYIFAGQQCAACPMNPMNVYYGAKENNEKTETTVYFNKGGKYYQWTVGSPSCTETNEATVRNDLANSHYFNQNFANTSSNTLQEGQAQIEEDVSADAFEPKNVLNPKFWVDGKLNSRVRLRLLDIADDFVKTLDVRWVKPEDIVLTGSIANYNWTKYSDVDVHIIMDYKKVYSKTDFVKNYFDAKKEEWNGSHEGLKIYGFNVELSVEDENSPAVASGVYSLESNEWVSEPKDLSDAKLNKEYVERTAEKYIEKIDKLESKIRKEKDAKRVEMLSEKMVAIFDKLKGMRKDGLKSKVKEMSSGNIIWKILRAEGYIQKIWDVINYNYDRSMSINEAVTGTDNKSAAALYVYAMDKDKTSWHILCAKRANRKGDEEGGKWNPPMGHLHRGENMVDGAIRECLEESGIDFREYKSNIKEMDSHRWGKNFRLVLKDKYTDDFKPGVGDEENETFIWLPVSEIDGKEWAWTCRENTERYAPKTVAIKESQRKMICESADNGFITLYHGVNVDKMEHNLSEGGFTPRVCSEGGPEAIWLSEKQYIYNFTFEFKFPKNLLRKKLFQQSTVDYIYTDFIPFDEFECRLVKTEFTVHGDRMAMFINLTDIDSCREQYKFFPELYEKFDKKMRAYPLVYERCVKPVMLELSKNRELAENKKTIILREEQLDDARPLFGTKYLNSYIGRFREKTGIPDLQTYQLHDLMAKLKKPQTQRSRYRIEDIEWLLDNPKMVRKLLGYDADNPIFFEPKNDFPRETEHVFSYVDTFEDDKVPALSKMPAASIDLLKKGEVFYETCSRKPLGL